MSHKKRAPRELRCSPEAGSTSGDDKVHTRFISIISEKSSQFDLVRLGRHLFENHQDEKEKRRGWKIIIRTSMFNDKPFCTQPFLQQLGEKRATGWKKKKKKKKKKNG